MTILEKLLEFVNENIQFQVKSISKNQGHPTKRKFHEDLLHNFEDLRNYLLEQQNQPSVTAQLIPKQPKLSLTPNDLEGLPDELLKQLSISDGDKTDFVVLNVLEEAGGVASLDQILIGIYRKTNEIIKRPNLTSRIYRMAQRDLIWSVPGKKGVYSNRPITEDEALALFGKDAD